MSIVHANNLLIARHATHAISSGDDIILRVDLF